MRHGLNVVRATAIVLFVLACAPSASSDAGVDAPAPLDAFAPGDAFFPFDAVTCTDGGADVPVELRACTTDRDCTVAIEWVDRCGSIAAHGVRWDELGTFLAAERMCERPLAPCSGFSYAVSADDGQTAPMGGVAVACESGLCTTSARAPANCGVWTCTSSQFCLARCQRGDAGIVLEERCVALPVGCSDPTACACITAANPSVCCGFGGRFCETGSGGC